jgi:hypothetical protein
VAYGSAVGFRRLSIRGEELGWDRSGNREPLRWRRRWRRPLQSR